MFKETIVTAGAVKPLKDVIKNLWLYRSLLLVFSMRDIKARYAQTFLGLAWLILTPLITVGVFTFVFGLMIKIPSDGLPYILFYLVAILSWNVFTSVFNFTASSIESNAGLISKIYFPRLLLGGSYAVSTSLDYLIGYGLITIFSIIFGLWNYRLIVFMPLLFLIQMLFALGLGFLLAPLATRYRDVKYLMPLCLQLYYFANPILYSISVAPHWLRFWYEINPVSVVITSYRQILLGHWPDGTQLLIGVISAFCIFMIGMLFFNRHDQNLVDIL